FLGKVYEITTATTAVEALSRVRRARFDLVVLDHRLPDRTGLEVLSELKSIHRQLPVVMLTGYGSGRVCASAFQLRVTDYLQKPVSAVDLVAAVQRILRPGVENDDSTHERRVAEDWSNQRCLVVQRATALIQERYWDRLSLPSLARQVGVSKYRLSHRFR